MPACGFKALYGRRLQQLGIVNAVTRAIDDPLGEKPHGGVLLVLQPKLLAGIGQSLAHNIDVLLFENFAIKKRTDGHGGTPHNLEPRSVSQMSRAVIIRPVTSEPSGRRRRHEVPPVRARPADHDRCRQPPPCRRRAPHRGRRRATRHRSLSALGASSKSARPITDPHRQRRLIE